MQRHYTQDPRRMNGNRRNNGSYAQQTWQGRQNNNHFNEPPHPSAAYEQDAPVYVLYENREPSNIGYDNLRSVPINDGSYPNRQWQHRTNASIDPADIPNGTPPFTNGYSEDPRARFANERSTEPGPGDHQYSRSDPSRRKSDCEEEKIEIAQSKQRIAELLNELALKCKETGNFDDAGKRYQELLNIKSREKTILREGGHEAQAKTVEAEEFSCKYKYGEMLSKTEKYDEAATVLKEVFRWRKDRDPNFQEKSTRETLLELCNVFRLGRSRDGLEKARILYRTQSDLDYGGSTESVDHSWRLRNALNVVCVLIQQDSCEDALKELIYVWGKRKGGVAVIESEIEGLLKLFRQKKAEDCAMRALRLVCEDNRKFSLQLVDIMATEGLRLHANRQYPEAVNFLDKAFTNTLPTAASDRMKRGWPLALSHCQMQNFRDPANILESLLPLSNLQTNPSEHCLKALLAYALLASSQPSSAKTNAKSVWDTHKTQNILQLPEYHHADTLIRAMAQDVYYNEKWKEAKDIWVEVYQNARVLCSDRQATSQVQFHIATGTMLAEEWEACRKTRSNQKKGKTTAEKSIAAIRNQVRDLEQMVPGPL